MDEKQVYAVYVDVLHEMKDMHNFRSAIMSVIPQWAGAGFKGVPFDMTAEYVADLWHFHKKYINKEMQDSDWQCLIDDSHELSEKYNNEYSHKMICIVANEIEREYKNRNSENNNKDGVQ